MTTDVEGRGVSPNQTPARRVLKFTVIALVVATILVFVDAREVVYSLRRIPLRILALAVVVLSLDRVMMGLKWRQLVQGAGAQMRLGDAVSIYYQSKLATLVFPAAFGGEVLRGILGVRSGVPSHVLVASMILERVVAAVSSLVLAGVGLAYLGTLPSYARFSGTVSLLVTLAGTCLVLTALVALHRPSHKLIGRLLSRWVPERVMRLLDCLSRTTVGYKHAPYVLLVNLGLTLVEHTLLMLALYILAVGLGVHLSFTHFMAATSIIMLVRRGAGFLEGWGIAESGVVMLYTLFGIAPSRSAALAVALWAVSLLTCLPAGYLLWRDAWRGAWRSTWRGASARTRDAA